MQVIKIFISNQRAWRYTSGIITEGSTLKFEFVFKTEDWNDVKTKTIVFSYKGNNYEIEPDENNQCYVPIEVLKAPSFTVSIYGGGLITNDVKIPVEPRGNSSVDIDIEQYINKKIQEVLREVTPAPKTVTLSLLASNWAAIGNRHMQIVSIADITPNSKVDLQPSPEQLVVFHEKDIAFTTENHGGIVFVYVIGDKPTNDYTIQATITEVVVNG